MEKYPLSIFSSYHSFLLPFINNCTVNVVMLQNNTAFILFSVEFDRHKTAFDQMKTVIHFVFTRCTACVLITCCPNAEFMNALCGMHRMVPNVR